MQSKHSGSRWATREEMEKNSDIVKLSLKGKIEKGGFPLGCDGDDFYIENDISHHLVIGSLGSGKTQTTILPMIHTLIESSESFLVTDVKGEIYNQVGNHLNEKDYSTFILNFKDYRRGLHWNPFTLVENYYQKGEKDKADEALGRIASYIFRPFVDTDPFWDNSAASYFVGLAHFLLENNYSDITLRNIFQLSMDLKDDKFLTSYFQKNDTVCSYLYLASIIEAPQETKKSIISVFEQKIKKFIVNDKLMEMMSVTDFDLENISHKVGIFVISSELANYSEMYSLFVDQIYEMYSTNTDRKKEQRMHFLLDEYGKVVLIHELDSLLRMARSKSITFTLLVESLKDFEYKYGKEDGDRIRDSFSTILYLLSNNPETLEEISNFCGQKEDGFPLISVEELRTLKHFQAILLKVREYPFLTYLKPDYQIDWGYEKKAPEIPEHELVSEKRFHLNAQSFHSKNHFSMDDLIDEIDKKIIELDQEENHSVQIKENENHKIVIEKTVITIYPKKD